MTKSKTAGIMQEKALELLGKQVIVTYKHGTEKYGVGLIGEGR